MWVDMDDQEVSRGCLEDAWEPEETQFFRSRLQAGDIVLDIGANIGWYSLAGAREIGSSGWIHAFEPRPETVRMLRRTVACNGLEDRVRIWDVALDERPGLARLWWEPECRNPGHSYLSAGTEDGKPSPGADEALGPRESARVRTVPLDELMPEVAPDFVKIDVEGAEPRVVAGAYRALRRRQPTVLSELYPEQLARVSGSSAAAYITQMAELGYRCFLLESGKPGRRLSDFPSDAADELVSVVFEATRD